MSSQIKTITVVMSVKNGEKYLAESINSILEQTFKDFEFIIVDNHSSDNSLKIIREYAEIDSRITIVERKIQGNYTDGRTAGIDLVKTEWFALMDADDISLPERLKTQINFTNKLLLDTGANDSFGWEIGAVGTHAYYCNEKGKLLGEMCPGATSLKEFTKNYKKNEDQVLIDPSTLIKKSAFKEVGGYRNYTDPPCDLDLWQRMAEKKYAFISIKSKLMLYRIHSGSNSVNNTLHQRFMTHFVNFNMRRRRSGQEEVSLEQFKINKWNNLNYKAPRIFKDYYFFFYKKAANAYGQNQIPYLIIFLSICLLMRPWATVTTVIRQKF